MNINKEKKTYDEIIKLANECVSLGNYNEAIIHFEEAFKFMIELQDYFMYGLVLIEVAKLSIAEDVFQKIMDYNFPMEAHYGLGRIEQVKYNIDEAILHFEKVKTYPDFLKEVYSDLARCYEDRAEKLNEEDLEEVNYKNAVLNFKLAIDYNNHYQDLLHLGSIYEHHGRNAEALYLFEKAYLVAKDEESVCYNLGVMYYKFQDKERARDYYLEELSHKTHYDRTYYNLGVLYKDLFQDYEQAKYYYLCSINENKEDYNSWYNLGCVHALLKDFKNAFDCFKYIKYKNDKYLNLLNIDEELKEFRETEYYDNLLKL